MRKLRLRKRNRKRGHPDDPGLSRILSSVSMNHFPAARTAPLRGGISVSFSSPTKTVFLFGKDHLCTYLKKERKKELFLIHSSKIKSSLFPQLLPSCAPHIEPFTSSARNYHGAKSRLFWAIRLCFHTRPVFNTPERSSSGQPSGSDPHLFNATSPDSRPLHPDAPFHDFIPFTVGNGSFNLDCTDKAE